MPNPLTKEESIVYNYDNGHLSGSTTCWIFNSMWNMSNLQHWFFKIRPRVYTTVCYSGDISMPLNMTHHKTTFVIGCFTCCHLASWAVLAHSKQPMFPDLLQSVWRSGYMTLIPIDNKNCFASDSNDIVPLCYYHLSCEWTLLLELEWLLKLYMYHWSYHLLCERALSLHSSICPFVGSKTSSLSRLCQK